MDGSAFTNANGAFMPFTPVDLSEDAPSRPRRGIVAGTLIATNSGWRPVEELAPGDKVQTFDNGMQTIVDIRSESLWDENQVSLSDPLPVVMPGGALCNTSPVILLPHQGILLESENACDAMGDPLAVVPARVLIGINGIETAAPQARMRVFTLTFASEEVIYADGGLMLHCPLDAPSANPLDDEQLYDVKTLVEARQMLTDMDIAQLVLDEESFDLYETAAVNQVA